MQGYEPVMKRQFCSLAGAMLSVMVSVIVMATAAGCAREANGRWSGPQHRAKVSAQAWQIVDRPGRVLRTQHYNIYTTIPDRDYALLLGQLMEGAAAEYLKLVPSVLPSLSPMACYVFADRRQWAAFTARRTGTDSRIYLKIPRGGYTIDDWFAGYFIGERSTLSVAAHEGWHQFVGRHFEGRLPPFLEEGIACMFETVRMDDGLPRWNLSHNPARDFGLRRAVEGKYLWPLEKLITLDAGDVVDAPREKIDAFYAQSWAFARFLREAEAGRYRPMFEALLGDTAAGTVEDPTGTLKVATRSWAPAAAQPILEHYLRQDLASIELAYLAFVKTLVNPAN
jgi:hypothetical protein